MKPGVYDLDFESYSSLKALNRGTIERLGITPAHAYHHMHKPQGKPTKALKMGIALHSLILEMKPAEVKLTELETDIVDNMVRALNSYVPCQKALDNSEKEKTLVWEDAETGQLCKARLDAYKIADETIYDIKSCSNIQKFSYELFVRKYHWQAAFYLQGAQALGLPLKKFKFICVENKPIFGCRVFSLTPEAMALGAHQISPLIQKFQECSKADQWPGYPEEEFEVRVPSTEIGDVLEMEE